MPLQDLLASHGPALTLLGLHERPRGSAGGEPDGARRPAAHNVDRVMDLQVDAAPTDERAEGEHRQPDQPYQGPPREHSPDPPDARLIRILVVDDHSIVRQGIRRILEERPNMEVVGEAEDGLTAVERVGILHPDVVLLDLQLPGLSGIETLPRLWAAHPAVEVIILTMFDQVEEVFAGLKAGARGYLLKDAAPAAIVQAVRAASRGESSLSPALVTRVLDRFAVLARREVDPDALTEREMDILGCMARGMPYKQIGVQLSITSKTVQYHVRNILQKLHVASRGEAVAVATEKGLLSRP